MIKKFNNLSYRKSVSAIVVKDSKYLVVQLINYKKNEWKFPSGGVEKDETEREVLIRELDEELGTKKFKIVSKCKYKNKYDWTEEMIKRKDSKWRGQLQSVFLVEFLGKDSEIKINKKEINHYKWVQKENLKDYLIFPGQYDFFMKGIEECQKEY